MRFKNFRNHLKDSGTFSGSLLIIYNHFLTITLFSSNNGTTSATVHIATTGKYFSKISFLVCESYFVFVKIAISNLKATQTPANHLNG